MNIALVGYGKMGRTIEQIAKDKGHTVATIIDHNNASALQELTIENTDVAIEFTGPEFAKKNILTLLKAGIPVVCGTTGWLAEMQEVEQYCKEINGSFLYASNFSIGVNIFFALNKKLADLMKDQSAYTASLEEIHHTQKKDAPSGTAITLAEQIIESNNNYLTWKTGAHTNPGELPIVSLREDPAPGTHSITYSSAIDDIQIKHTAHNRLGFASGAVLAAEYIAGKKGLFTMQDVLNL